MEPLDDDGAVGVMHAGEQARQRPYRVGCGAAVPAGMQVLGGAGDGEVERDHAAARHGDGGKVDAPHGAVRRDGEVAGEPILQARHRRRKTRAADLLLAFDQHLDVDRQRSAKLQERLRRQDGDEERALVVGGAARIEALSVDRRREWRGEPFVERVGRLHVVVPVDHDGRRPGRVTPFGGHQRMPLRLDDLDRLEAGPAEAVGDEFEPLARREARRRDRC